MKLSRVRALACLTAAAAVSLLLAPTAAHCADGTLECVPSPEGATGNNTLGAVASVSATDMWAVGSAQDGNGNTQALIEHWNGTTWRALPAPSHWRATCQR